MKKKGVYLYDFMDAFDKFGYKELPTKDELFSIWPKKELQMSSAACSTSLGYF